MASRPQVLSTTTTAPAPPTTAAPPPTTAAPPPTTAAPAPSTTAKPKTTTTPKPTTTTTIGIAPALIEPSNTISVTTTTSPPPPPGAGHVSPVFPALSIGAVVLLLVLAAVQLARTGRRFGGRGPAAPNWRQ